MWVIGVGSGKGVSSSLSSRILTGQNYEFLFCSFLFFPGRPVRFRRPTSLSLYVARWWWWWWWMTPVCRFHQVSVPIKTPFLFRARLGLAVVVVVVVQEFLRFQKPPPTKSPAPQSELYNVILHTHKVPRPLVQRLHTLFSTARLTRSSLFLDSIDEWNEQKHSQCVCVCVCVYIWALRVSRVLSLKRSCRCISHRPFGGN